MADTRTITLAVEDVRLLHLASATTVQLYDVAEQADGVPTNASLYGKRDRLLELARNLDHHANCGTAQPNKEQRYREALEEIARSSNDGRSRQEARAALKEETPACTTCDDTGAVCAECAHPRARCTCGLNGASEDGCPRRCAAQRRRFPGSQREETP